ncbi:Hypothetical protein NG00_02013 [Corynebacterium camporealensis]|uniref:Uncharacterized protein n=1 Tax=Corynebacterium camporealensis TaxID=161896 RepID=A0A0F6QXT8_9CORY|nr:hypothetical protein [Corynebacterium camporealensis]AKE40187.1 hypothetical protein UL81_11290 [Corynebacterium camporealensis]AVH89251.1 Hypothetical protein NG00_02013 [Corynebacterium camporealensis]MDY5839169.1 hypothetical protein [Corynebacterium camporealensis]
MARTDTQPSKTRKHSIPFWIGIAVTALGVVMLLASLLIPDFGSGLLTLNSLICTALGATATVLALNKEKNEKPSLSR